jgi:hypothetical protein
MDTLFDRLPLGVAFLLLVVFILLFIEVGHRLGDRVRRRAKGEPEGPVGTVVGATLGLLAFVLAFTFGSTASRHDARKELLLDDVNTIETAHLRAGLLREPHRSAARAALVEYADLRAGLTLDNMERSMARTDELQRQLWSVAAALAEADRSSEIDALFIGALNEMFDLHTKRVTVGLQYRLPNVLWLALFFVLALAMAGVGYQFGLVGKRAIAVDLGLALTFTAVVLLIIELDRGGRGYFRASQQPVKELQQRLHAAPP